MKTDVYFGCGKVWTEQKYRLEGNKKSALVSTFFLKIKGDVVLLVTGVIFVTNDIDNISMNFVQNVNWKCFVWKKCIKINKYTLKAFEHKV